MTPEAFSYYVVVHLAGIEAAVWTLCATIGAATVAVLLLKLLDRERGGQ